jgi:DNA excision repair protein ERCC-3
MRGPLVIQSDHTLMLEVDHEQYSECRDFLATFAELVKSPEFIHTYRVTSLSMWNAAALDIWLDDITHGLKTYSRYPVPPNVLTDINEWYRAYGKLVLRPDEDNPLHITLHVYDDRICERLKHEEVLKHYWLEVAPKAFQVLAVERGNLKQTLVKVGYPVKDLCGYLSGDVLQFELNQTDQQGQPFALRDYQQDAVETFYQAGRETGGSGVLVLPCGAGKTIIGLGAMAAISSHTLIITTNNVAVHQWRDEILDKTSLLEDHIGEYTGLEKTVKPVTITTYQMLTYRKSRQSDFDHLHLFTEFNWGLIIYDEVHLLPAPVFRATTAIQARRRLGLTATLIREDNRQDDVFALIGPKRYDVPWKTLEKQGYIAEAYCTEYRLELSDEEELQYAHADKRQKFRIAAENSIKNELVTELIENHVDDLILVIGQYISQLEILAEQLDAPLITGKTKNAEREILYDQFRKGEVRVLVVSKVANFAVDLPDANVMIQVSGTFGSRQEEAQRLGRILRPKKKRSHFYTLVSRNTTEQDFSLNRQMFLVEQGYRYQIHYYDI